MRVTPRTSHSQHPKDVTVHCRGVQTWWGPAQPRGRTGAALRFSPPALGIHLNRVHPALAETQGTARVILKPCASAHLSGCRGIERPAAGARRPLVQDGQSLATMWPPPGFRSHDAGGRLRAALPAARRSNPKRAVLTPSLSRGDLLWRLWRRGSGAQGQSRRFRGAGAEFAPQGNALAMAAADAVALEPGPFVRQHGLRRLVEAKV